MGNQARLQDSLNIFLDRFEPFAQKFFEKKTKEVSKYPPLIKRFYKDLYDFTSGGKKLRGFLVWMGYRISQKSEVRSQKFRDLEKILPVALAYELLHSFLLIHDDIIDQSDTRRGRRTIHKQYEKPFGPSASLRASKHYGLSQAIVLGDIACFEALDLVNTSGFTDSQKIACFAKIITTIIKTGYGEALDIQYSHKKTDFNNIRQMTELKTAKYTFVGPLTVGAILGGVNKIQIQALTRFGLKVGLAFQIQDDILGTFGEEKITGKSALDDLCEGKNTLLIHKTKEMLSDQKREELTRLWGKRNAGSADLRKVQRLIVDSGALSWAENEKAKLVRSAKVYIKSITRDNDLQSSFSELADFVITRDK